MYILHQFYNYQYKYLIENFNSIDVKTWNLERVKKTFTGYDLEAESFTFIHLDNKGIEVKKNKNYKTKQMLKEALEKDGIDTSLLKKKS